MRALRYRLSCPACGDVTGELDEPLPVDDAGGRGEVPPGSPPGTALKHVLAVVTLHHAIEAHLDRIGDEK